jgi:hypothetical protein
MQLQVGLIFTPGPVGRVAHLLGLRFSHAFIRYEAPEGWRVIDAGFTGIGDRPGTGLEKATDYRIMETRDPLDEPTKQRILDYAQGNVGKPYHYIWLLKLAWRLVRQRVGIRMLAYPSHVCTSLIVDCFHHAGIDLVPSEEILVTPDEIAASDKLIDVPALAEG